MCHAAEPASTNRLTLSVDTSEQASAEPDSGTTDALMEEQELRTVALAGIARREMSSNQCVTRRAPPWRKPVLT